MVKISNIAKGKFQGVSPVETEPKKILKISLGHFKRLILLSFFRPDPQCHCDDGYGGEDCSEVDVNECKYKPCSLHAECTNTLGSFYCTCREGYSGDGFDCDPVPEPSAAEGTDQSAETRPDSEAQSKPETTGPPTTDVDKVQVSNTERDKDGSSVSDSEQPQRPKRPRPRPGKRPGLRPKFDANGVPLLPEYDYDYDYYYGDSDNVVPKETDSKEGTQASDDPSKQDSQTKPVEPSQQFPEYEISDQSDKSDTSGTDDANMPKEPSDQFPEYDTKNDKDDQAGMTGTGESTVPDKTNVPVNNDEPL